MPSLARQALPMPFWPAQVVAQEEFFARNPIIGNRWLNERGLPAARVVAAHRLASSGLAEFWLRKPRRYRKSVDLLERCGLGRPRGRRRGSVSALDPA